MARSRLPYIVHPRKSELSEVRAVEGNAASEGRPRPRDAGRHRAEFQQRMPPGTSGMRPRRGSPSKPGVLAQEEPTIPTRSRARLWLPEGSRACPPRAVVATAGTARERRAPRTGRDGPAEYNRRQAFSAPSICTVCRNSRFIGFYGLQRPGRGASVLTAPTVTRRALLRRFQLDRSQFVEPIGAPVAGLDRAPMNVEVAFAFVV